MPRKPLRLLALIGPGLLVAATGVGAGDLSTGAFTGSKLGLAVLWAVVLGAFFKFVLNEGLARWQLATKDTLLEGAVHHLGRPVRWIFLVYLLAWSFLVGAALMSAVGVTGHALFPLFGNVLPGSWLPTSLTGWTAAQGDKIVYGMLHSAVAAAIIRFGGYRWFERVMGVCIAVMFVVVLGTAIALQPPLVDVAQGLFLFRIPKSDFDGLGWTIALMGGVGGTVTVLCYGYWIREEGREGVEALKTCRIDLATGYIMTALFGMAMLVIGSQLPTLEGKGATLMVQLADQVELKLGSIGPTARWAFLIGAWGAVFSSLLGVWQSVPYLFADFWNMARWREGEFDRQQVDTRGLPYRGYLWGIATVPILGLMIGDFQDVQKANAIVGALFIPMLAGVLLILNGRAKWVGERYRNKPATVVVLVAVLLFFLLALALTIWKFLPK
ncbi:MAG: Nramp family divalent metal transporter [Pirellulaceae bacterium]